jgi:hypothetical protein
MGYGFPGVDDLLLEFIEEGIVLLLLVLLFLVAIVVGLVVFVFVLHFKYYY